MTITLDHVRAAIHLTDFDPVSAQLRMAPSLRPLRPEGDTVVRQAGVLVLIYPADDGLELLLTRRADSLRGHHSGQISFPGGRRDPHDKSFTATALRETCEETGLCGPDIGIVGLLTPIYIPPSNYEVHPVVAYLGQPPVCLPNPAEVAEVFGFPLNALLDARSKAHEEWETQGVRVQIPFYTVHGHKVWGATAIMLSELEGRLRAVLPGEALPGRGAGPRTV